MLPTLALAKWPSKKELKGPQDPLHILLITDMKKTCLEKALRSHELVESAAKYKIVIQVCSGLGVLHSSGIAHTNLKL